MISTQQDLPADGLDTETPIGLNDGLIRFVAKMEADLVPVLEPDEILTPELLGAIRKVTSTPTTEIDR